MEDPNDWIHRIALSLRGNHGQATFGQILTETRLSPGALFLGLLVGHECWGLQQTEFYGQVMVILSANEA